ncbi:MAG TPA: NAD-dependent epimerase/dehydratase family protein, partial [bacterium]|nr:NAD-dependent epimerase/dehydratase family protein [bacterium]
MRIIVTGGAGFIASHVVDAFIKDGHTVGVVDNLSSGKRENINPAAMFFEVDIRDKEKLDEVFDSFKPDIIDHHAAQINVRYSVEDPVYDASVNIIGSLNLLELSRKYQVKRIIFASTGGAIYGDA